MCFWSNPETAKELSDNDPTMSMDLFRRGLREAIPWVRSVGLAAGGEYLSDPMLEERLAVLGEALRMHPEVYFEGISNASMLRRETLGFLRRVQRAVFTLSIDSADALVYASVRRPGKLFRAEENIRQLRPALTALGVGFVHMSLNVVLMKRTLLTLPATIRLAHEIGATVNCDHAQGFGPDLSRESLFGVPVFANLFLERCERLAKRLGVGFSRPPPFAVTADEIRLARVERPSSCSQLDEAVAFFILTKIQALL